jgi:hypothetical protein
MNVSRARVFLFLVLQLCCYHLAAAQDLSPRAYLITPVGSNAAVLSSSYLSGNIQFSGAVPITGAREEAYLGIASYYHALSLFGRSANFTVAVPYAVGDIYGQVFDVPKQAHRSGSLDSVARLSVNLIGGPAMQPPEFARWTQTILLGTSLTIVAPTGQYDSTRLINWGSNRWAFKPELGYSQRWGHWVLDAYGGVWFFTTNPEFFSHNQYFPGTNTQSQAPTGAVEAHMSYDFLPRLWVSFDANFWWGGATSINGVENPLTNQSNSRVGITASFPITKRQSIKVSYSDGAYIRYGGNFRSVSVGWQYAWIGWPKFH